MSRNSLIFGILIFFLLFSCNKKQEEISDLEKIKYSNNKNSYPKIKMDSAQAINSITKQKVQELLDLSVIYASGNKNTEIDSLIYSQITSYFTQADSTRINPLIKELDSLKVKSIKVKELTTHQEFKGRDTINIASFTIEYFGKNKEKIGYFDKKASYIFQKTPVKFAKEFKFYFCDFDLKENTPSSDTK